MDAVAANPVSAHGEPGKPAGLAYERIAFTDVPGWSTDDHAAALDAFMKSSGPVLASAPADPTLVAVCRQVLACRRDKHAARAFFETHFVPHRLVHDRGPGLVTGYFEPVLDGSREPHGAFRVPLYRRPPELANLTDETLRGASGSSLTHARRTAQGFEPYFTRAEIESGALLGRGLELLYLADPVDAFFVHVQGSAQIRLSDGTTVRVSYDGKNGHPYVSIGRHLIATGALKPDEVTLESLAAWLRADPERGREVMWQNPSFVFFRERAGGEGSGPVGALDIPLTPGRSLAVDASTHALGLPIYVVAPGLEHGSRRGEAFQRLMIAQDVGSAIRGPERGDIFFGSGEDAGRLAGVTKHAARFIVLLPRPGESPPG